MAKGTGLIGNFKGKVGNMVGYNLKDSNNKQTQGIRVYQPVVRNPKSYAQAQQRCIMKPINDFYRALKLVISRGQEGKAYGNASRLAWLKNVMKDFNGPWLVKGSTEQWPINCQITAGSLICPEYVLGNNGAISFPSVSSIEGSVNTVATLTAALKRIAPYLQDGDQITMVAGNRAEGSMVVDIKSVVLSSTDDTAVTGFSVSNGELQYNPETLLVPEVFWGCAIISREGSNGEHLRSSAELKISSSYKNATPYLETDKPVAIASYMSAGANTDWPQEALEG